MRLTRRQTQVTELVASGYSTRQLTETLGISEVTLRTHLRNIFTRLSVRRRFQIVAAVIEEAVSMRWEGEPGPAPAYERADDPASTRDGYAA